MQTTTTWSAGLLIGLFDHERAAWVSLTSPADGGAAEFLLTPQEFPDFDTVDARWLGDIVVQAQSPGEESSWSVHSSALREHRRVIEDADAIIVEHGPDPQARGLLLRQQYWVDSTGEGLVWRTEIHNSTKEPVTLVRVGVPLLMNQYFRNDQQFKYERCVLRHSAIIHANSWFYWAKSSGAGPILGLKALNDTALEAFSVDRSDSLWGSRSSFESAFEGTYTAYAIHPQTAEFPACTGPRSLAPGETVALEFALTIQPGLEELHQWLADHGGFYLRADPGMVAPIETEATLTIRAAVEPIVTAVDDADQVGPLAQGPDRQWQVPVQLAGYGRRAITVAVNGQESRIEMWGIEPPESIFAQQAAFIASNQWETDESDPAYHGLLQWDLESARRVNASHNPGLPRWMEGGSDEIGLVSGLFLSEWNVYRPDEEQIRVLQHYCQDFIEDRLTEQPGWRLHRAVPWFTMFDSWTGRGVDDIWRAFNYVHVVNTYHNMYRIADRYSFDWLEDKKIWLAKAFHYTQAMFTFWMFPEGVGATDYGNMGEAVIATELAAALRREGMSHEAALLDGWVGRKALYLASKPFPFGSEMAYDSTAFEAVYAYGKSIADTDLMRHSIAATLGNRGVQPVWYLYMTDVRGGGDSRWNVSYMTQLGAVSLADWLLEQGCQDSAIARALFGSFLAGFSIFNSGGYLSGDERNRGAAGWIAVGEKGEFSGNDGEPHLKGIVGLSGEGALGFYGALRSAMSIVFQDAGRWRALGADLSEAGPDGTYCVVPNDGLRTRFLDITHGTAIKLERDALHTVRRTATGLHLTIENIAGDAHELDLWIRLPEPDDYTISTGAQGSSIEQPLGGTRWNQLTLNLPAAPRVHLRIARRWQRPAADGAEATTLEDW